jgi:hypothetical protein
LPTLPKNESLQTQLERNDVPLSAFEPGPGHYFGPASPGFSSLGKQITKKGSAPEVGFAKTGWKQWEKVVISKHHEGGNRCRLGPGHCYTPADDGLDKLGTKIGKGLRPKMGVDPDASPGPAYNIRDCPEIGEHLASPKDKSFGISERFRKKTGGTQLGPGEYAARPTLNLATGRSFGIHRAAYDKVIRPGWETEGCGKASPGVGPPMWKDLKKDGSGAYSIGKGARFTEAKSQDFPGPGKYRQTEKDVGATLAKGSVCSDAQRPGSIKFGKGPKKPRFRIQLAMNCPNSGWGYF